MNHTLFKIKFRIKNFKISNHYSFLKIHVLFANWVHFNTMVSLRFGLYLKRIHRWVGGSFHSVFMWHIYDIKRCEKTNLQLRPKSIINFQITIQFIINKRFRSLIIVASS